MVRVERKKQDARRDEGGRSNRATRRGGFDGMMVTGVQEDAGCVHYTREKIER